MSHEQEAFIFWRRRFAKRIFSFDEDITPYLNPKIEAWQPNQKSWLALARQALHLSSSFITSKIGKGQSSLSYFEAVEKTGQITLNNLYKITEAMDCELIVAIRPKNNRNFSEALWDKILPEAKKNFLYSNPDVADSRKTAILAFAAQDRFFDQEVMRKLGLSRKKTLLEGRFIRR